MTDNLPQVWYKSDLTGNPLPVTIDADTGEILSEDESPILFRTLDEAESFIFASANREESLKIQQIKALLSIKDQKLYLQAQSEEGETFKSFEQYLKSLSQRLIPLDGAKPRSIKSWMTRIRIYQEQLGYDDFWLRKMGYHGEILLPVAARGVGLVLSTNDEVTDTGGERYGKERFLSLCEEVSEHVFKSQDDPSYAWTVQSTKDLVDEILKRSTLKAVIELKAKQVGTNYVIEDILWWVDEQPFRIGQVLSLDEFKLLASTAKNVSGVGDDWKDK